MLLNTCFGFSSLRSGANVIAIFNMIITGGGLFIKGYALFKESFRRIEEEFYPYTYETTPKEWQDHRDTSMFIFSMCTALILVTNIVLKQSTYMPALHKIYAWLVINYITLLCLVINLINYITLFKKISTYSLLFRYHGDYISHGPNFTEKFLFAAIYAVEIYIVQSYYIKEQNAMLNDIVQVKWKHVSKNQVISQGTAYPSASNFKDTMPRQVQEGFSQTKIPPFVTNILLDRA